jgi:hypothetical protein
MGNFMDDVAATGTFTIESLVERIKILLAEDSKLVEKLVTFEAEMGAHRTSAEQANKALEEHATGLQASQKQVRNPAALA